MTDEKALRHVIFAGLETVRSMFSILPATGAVVLVFVGGVVTMR